MNRLNWYSLVGKDRDGNRNTNISRYLSDQVLDSSSLGAKWSSWVATLRCNLTSQPLAPQDLTEICFHVLHNEALEQTTARSKWRSRWFVNMWLQNASLPAQPQCFSSNENPWTKIGQAAKCLEVWCGWRKKVYQLQEVLMVQLLQQINPETGEHCPNLDLFWWFTKPINMKLKLLKQETETPSKRMEDDQGHNYISMPYKYHDIENFQGTTCKIQLTSKISNKRTG